MFLDSAWPNCTFDLYLATCRILQRDKRFSRRHPSCLNFSASNDLPSQGYALSQLCQISFSLQSGHVSINITRYAVNPVPHTGSKMRSAFDSLTAFSKSDRAKEALSIVGREEHNNAIAAGRAAADHQQNAIFPGNNDAADIEAEHRRNAHNLRAVGATAGYTDAPDARDRGRRRLKDCWQFWCCW